MDQDDDPDMLDAAALSRIMACLGPEQPRITNVLQMAAIGYRVENRKVATSLDRGTKLELKRLAAQMNAAATALDNATLQTLVFASVHDAYIRGRYSGLLQIQKSVRADLRVLQAAFDAADTPRPKSIPNLDVPMGLALPLLALAYEYAASKAPTHSATRDGEYVGRPLSKFGRFVVAFFAEVDASRSERSLATSIRKYIGSRPKR
jgi:hypothetical protein